MNEALMAGFWRYIINVPPSLWEKQVQKGKSRIQREMRFMSDAHRTVHHFVVRELPNFGKPMPPAWIADGTGLGTADVEAILDDLEKHMTFLFRNPEGCVIWAYPVTVEQTPHRALFGTGEEIFTA